MMLARLDNEVNFLNEGIKRATKIMSFENINPDEWEESKKEAGRRKVIRLERDEGRDEAKIEIAKKALAKGFDNKKVVDLTDLSLEQVEELRTENGQ